MTPGDVHVLRPPRGRVGHEQRGRRFAVVLQSSDFERLSTVVVAPTSASTAPASFRPEVEVEGESTRVMVEQVMGVDRSRLGERVGALTFEELEDTRTALRLLLDLW